MQLKRIGAMSLARLAAGLYSIIGLLVGIVVALMAMAGASLGGVAGDSSSVFGLIFGVGAVVFLPVLYGVFGALGALLVAGLYNLLAGWLGGVELTLE